MTDHITNTAAKPRHRNLSLLVWSGAALMLATPLVAMRFTKEVAWTAFDFAVFGAMLAIACGTFELALRASGNLAFRAAVGVAVATGFFIVWACGAVGIIGDEGNLANLMFGGVLLVAVAGGFVAKFGGASMARALVATAFVQAVVGIIAQMMGSAEGFIASGVFTGAWLLSAWLFAKAARDEAAAV
jgi:hypothetical protein